MKKTIVAVALAAISIPTLTSAQSSAGAGVDAKTETRTEVSRESRLSDTKAMSTKRSGEATVSVPLLPILLHELGNYEGQKPEVDSISEMVCNSVPRLLSSADYEAQLERVKTNLKKLESEKDELVKRLASAASILLKPQEEFPRICADLIFNRTFSRPYVGWPYTNPDPQEMQKSANGLIKRWIYNFPAGAIYLQSVAETLAKEAAGLSEDELRARARDELKKQGPIFVENVIAMIDKVKNQGVDVTTDSTGFKGVRFIALIDGQGYDFQGTPSGTYVYKNSAMWLGNNVIAGKEYTINVTQQNAASMTKTNQNNSTSTNTSAGSVEGGVGVR